MLGESERLERVWDSGLDHSAELAEVDAMLADLVDLLGTGEFKAGTPQRVRLNHRITELAARQEELSRQTVKTAGWTWEPTRELFGSWWASQGVQERNRWLRSMGVRLEWRDDRVHLDLGDIFGLTQQLIASGPVVGLRNVLSTMTEHDVAGVVVGPDGEETYHGPDGQVWKP